MRHGFRLLCIVALMSGGTDALASAIALGTVTGVSAKISGLPGPATCSATDATNLRLESWSENKFPGGVVTNPDPNAGTVAANVSGSSTCVATNDGVQVDIGDFSALAIAKDPPRFEVNIAGAAVTRRVDLGTFYFPGATTMAIEFNAEYLGAYDIDPVDHYRYFSSAGTTFFSRLVAGDHTYYTAQAYESTGSSYGSASPESRSIHEQMFFTVPWVWYLPAGNYSLSLITSFSASASSGYWTPEPGTFALLSMGLLGLGLSRRRKAN